MTIKGSLTIDTDLLVRGVTLSGSDLRIKDQVENIDDDTCVNIIKAVKPKSYIRNDISDASREIGFIAQDKKKKQLNDDMLNLVKEIPDNTHGSIYAIDYSRLTTLLWGVCRNLIKRIEILESK